MKISAGTIARTIVLALALINQVLTMAGINPIPISDDQIYEICTLVATVCVSIWTWWKNTPITQEAIKAQEYLDELKGK